MIKKFFVTLLAATTLFSCSSDDDNNNELSVEQRKALDDEAIEEYLNDHYFSPINGKVLKFDTIAGNQDDANIKLSELTVKDPAGYYYAMRPGVEANGDQVIEADSSKILISYQAKVFEATNDLDTYAKKYGYVSTYTSSIDSGDGSAQTDPSFYKAFISPDMIANGVKREHIELKNFTEALKKFKSTGTNGRDLYNFQGIIILPSQLAYARNRMYTGTAITENHAYRNTSFIFNFELHKVTPR